MRKSQLGGVCGDCGVAAASGLYWRTVVRVLDYGVDTIAPKEPDTTQPVRCDRCETIFRVHADFTRDAALAAQVYCAATPEAALRLLGLE